MKVLFILVLIIYAIGLVFLVYELKNAQTFNDDYNKREDDKSDDK